MRAALIQLNTGDDPAANLPVTLDFLRAAAAGGATLLLTPEATNIITPDRDRQRAVLLPEAGDPTLAALRGAARELGVWLSVGSLSLRHEDPAEERFANRSFLIAPDGGIAARYDKIHMFDADIGEGESFRESRSFRPGDRAVLAQGPCPMGLTICYDLRFPALYRRLARAGATILTVPSAFHPKTGEAHWHVLLRARGIETGCFVLAAAQTGTHPAPHSPGKKPRESYGRSLAVAPWGEVLADAGTEPGVTLADLDMAQVRHARARVPAWRHDPLVWGP
ncbi:carbon-nitrogen hydrolase family protein [Paracoccus sp. (in: a-proteobacteria)]|uniref:carbon-nitrogen hydrolase family protein n=1 Tax=Paracoccus sp. TaxID=267 RepID=UPI0026E0FF59|nr:carbon-nitrogen hydrolase family protein [Paracoccus sp. (in: a-proteobacteria)]MDO5370148.1 carbon-nitrogen hydrolase family protein [Paracoccus sp. (in: a-proteobacteria)]